MRHGVSILANVDRNHGAKKNLPKKADLWYWILIN